MTDEEWAREHNLLIQFSREEKRLRMQYFLPLNPARYEKSLLLFEHDAILSELRRVHHANHQ